MPHANTDSGRVVNGRYRLGGVLGKGGMSIVHRAWDQELRRLVAVKLYVPGADPAADARLREEARMLAGLSHPVLLPVYDAGLDEDERPFLVMRLVDGCNLRQRLDEGPLPPPLVRSVGARLADGLAHVHAHGVVHRDVKPANILLDSNDEPYLADFGISRLMADAARLTATGQFVGTAGYLAPEQVLGEDAGAPADVYALGLVLVECLTGRAEYAGTDVEAAVARLHRAPVIPEDTPAGLAEVLAAMTARDPADRPTAAQCAALLDLPETTGPATHGLPAILDVIAEGPFAAARRSTALPRERNGGLGSGRERRTLVALTPVSAAGRWLRTERRRGITAMAAGSVLLAGLAWSLTTGALPGSPTPASAVEPPAAESVGVIKQQPTPSTASPQAPAPAPATVEQAVQQQPPRPARQPATPKKGGGKKHGDDGDRGGEGHG
jgi:eukaryotic-like serine/threonine-protein kinase